MNRRDLNRAVAAHTARDVKDVEEVLSALTEVVTGVVAQGEPVVITGFAKFTKNHRPARMARNPATGAPVRVPAKTVAKATAMKSFKDAVMSPRQAPRLARGVWPTDPDLLARQAQDRKAEGAGRPGAATTPARSTAGPRKATATKATAKKATVTKAATKKATVKKAAARTTTKRAPAKKATTKRPVAKKTAVKKAVAKKTVAKKTVSKRAPARRAAR